MMVPEGDMVTGSEERKLAEVRCVISLGDSIS